MFFLFLLLFSSVLYNWLSGEHFSSRSPFIVCLFIQLCMYFSTSNRIDCDLCRENRLSIKKKPLFLLAWRALVYAGTSLDISSRFAESSQLAACIFTYLAWQADIHKAASPHKEITFQQYFSTVTATFVFANEINTYLSPHNQGLWKSRIDSQMCLHTYEHIWDTDKINDETMCGRRANFQRSARGRHSPNFSAIDSRVQTMSAPKL